MFPFSIPGMMIAGAFNSMMSPMVLPMIGMQIMSMAYMDMLNQMTQLQKPYNNR